MMNALLGRVSRRPDSPTALLAVSGFAEMVAFGRLIQYAVIATSAGVERTAHTQRERERERERFHQQRSFGEEYVNEHNDIG
jgi:hypothetical protein